MSETDLNVFPGQTMLRIEINNWTDLIFRHTDEGISLAIHTSFVSVTLPLQDNQVTRIAHFLALWVARKRD